MHGRNNRVPIHKTVAFRSSGVWPGRLERRPAEDSHQSLARVGRRALERVFCGLFSGLFRARGNLQRSRVVTKPTAFDGRPMFAKEDWFTQTFDAVAAGNPRTANTGVRNRRSQRRHPYRMVLCDGRPFRLFLPLWALVLSHNSFPRCRPLIGFRPAASCWVL